MPNITEMLSAKKFYVADCAIEDVAVEPDPSRKGVVESWALGRAILASGAIELAFNWVAQGGSQAQDAFVFQVMLDEEEPDCVLDGLEDLSPDEAAQATQLILQSTNWQQEVKECLPSNAAELAALQ